MRKPCQPRVAPCEPLCGLFGGRVASMYPCTGFRQRWGNVAERCKKRFETLMEAGFEGKMAGSKRVQVKGRVALKSPLARFTPPGKAEQDCSAAPTDFSFPETGGGMEEKRGHRGRF